MTVITRFAPSPTGFLHIGGARTALFNWLYAKHCGGKFLLRIEDTDRARSTQAAVDAILDGLSWLGLKWDEPPIFQFARAGRHADVAHELLAKGHAYRCYCSPEELEAMRTEQRAKGLPLRYDGRWRDRDPSEAPAGVSPTIRLKAPRDGETVVEDRVQGSIRVAHSEIDDMVLLRADGTPTYMLSVVVDDHDMGITHVIRGSDHLTNTFRQIQLYRACRWDTPIFGHIPLIHGADGAKLSKRHGALGAEAYRDMGFLPEALRNYLLRLGWSHGDDEIISTEQAIAWFDLDAIGQAPARFDLAKLTSINGHYLRIADNERLAELIAPRMEIVLGHPVNDDGKTKLVRAMAGLKERAKTLVELADAALFYVKARPITLDEKARKVLDDQGLDLLGKFRVNVLAAVQNWRQDELEGSARRYVESVGLGLGKFAQPIRAALTGSATSPPIFEVMEILGREESMARIEDVLERTSPSDGH